MAKISARGDVELTRWTRKDGYTLLLTRKGRLLRKLNRHSGYNVMKTDVKWDEAVRIANENNATEVR